MLTIIEKEIAKRKLLIVDKIAKTEEAGALRAKADLLDKKAADIDVDVLNEEIEELEGYLPKPDIIPDEQTNDTTAAADTL